MSQLEIINSEYTRLVASIVEYKEAIKETPNDWILALHLARAEHRTAFLESQLSAQAA